MVRVVTDSGADLSLELCKRHDIRVVPLTITFGAEEFKDGVTLTTGDFYDRLQSSPDMPSTTQPSPNDFAEVYQQLKDEGATEIISIHLSSKLSGTFQSATLGAREVPGVNVRTVDSKAASLGIGLLALEAAVAAERGDDPESIVSHLQGQMSRLGIYFVVDTLEYLAKNGRIGKAKALLGGVLKIKPILSLVDGVVEPIGKARGQGKAIGALVEQVQRHTQGRPFRGAVMHALAHDVAEEVHARLVASAPGTELELHALGPTIGTHAGPGTVGVAAFAP